MERTSPVRVLWVANGLGVGGMERLLVNHARLGDRDGFEYHAAYLVERPHSVIADLEAEGVPVYRLGSGRRSDPRWIRDLVNVVGRRRIDVVHAHSPLPASVARVVLRSCARDVRFVYTEHNRWDRFEPATRWANRLTFDLNDAIFAVSADCRDTVSARSRHRVQVLEHGIDVDEVAAAARFRDEMRHELGVGETTVVFGTVANLRKQKNYPLLMRAAKRLIDDGRDVRFVAVGQGPLDGELRALHEQLGLGDRFRFLGFRADVHRVMSAFDVFVMSSDHEGLPVALMESKALGLPAVSTAVGGIPDAVTDGVDGVLVPKGDEEALAAALVRLADDRRLCARLASGAAASAPAWDARRAIKRIETTYRMVAGAARSSAGDEVSWSVVIPTHDRCDLLRRAITSVLRQDLPVDEVIVVDDASEEDLRGVVEAFDDPRLRLIRLDTNDGAPAARNAGLAAAVGSHVGLLDSDDEWHPSFTREMTAALGAAGLAVAGFELVVDGRPERTVVPTFAASSAFRDFAGGWHGGANTSCFALRPALWADPPRFDEELPALQDLDFALRAARSTRVVPLRSALVTRHVDRDRERVYAGRRPLVARRMLLDRWAERLEEVGALGAQRQLLVRDAALLGECRDTEAALASLAESRPVRARLLAALGSIAPSQLPRAARALVVVDRVRGARRLRGGSRRG